LVAITADGRKLEVALDPEQNDVRFDFPVAAAARSSPVPPPVSTPKTPKPSDDGLADSPYGAK
jgi:hypothetical protein